MKRVSFEIAKALTKAGYPDSGHVYYSTDDETLFDWNEIVEWDNKYYHRIPAPRCLEVWLWLWREKKIAIPADYFGYDNNYWSSYVPLGDDGRLEFFEPFHDPEEAIIKAIEYLITNDLIT